MKKRTITLKMALISSVILIGSMTVFSQDGGELFKKNCGICHSVGKGKLVGPDLKDVGDRYKEPWLLQWIKSSQSLVKKKDKIALEVFNKNGGMVMPDQILSDDEKKSVLAYLKEESGKLNAAATTKAPEQAVVATAALVRPVSLKQDGPMSDTSWALLFSAGLNVFLVIVVIVMGNAIKDVAGSINNS